ncbi:MAG: NAD-dependent epimerase/dehydratase family protein [Gammaproteobacteria bacterium]|nr:NAD-dependent epimerase/dehydratase family protein [Gammaproteobacteria bacterium]
MPTPNGAVLTIVTGVGYVGRRVLAALPRSTRLGLSRSPNTADTRLLDLDSDTPALPEMPAAYDVIYTVPPRRKGNDDLRLQTFLDLLPGPPRRFVYLSTSGVYGDCQGRRVDESTPTNATTPRAKRRVDAERRLIAYCRHNGTRLVVLRVPGIYGPGRLGLDRIRESNALLAEEDANPGNRIHVDDLARCCIAALAVDTVEGIFNVGDGDDRSSTWFAMELARQAGLDAPPVVSRARAEKTFSDKRLSFLRESRRLDLAKMRSELNVDVHYADAADGIAASLKEEPAQNVK